MWPRSNERRPFLLASPTGEGSMVLMVMSSAQPVVEHDRRVLQILFRGDGEPRHEEEPAADVRGRLELERRGGRVAREDRRSLAEHIEQAEDRDRAEQAVADPTDDDALAVEPLEVAVALEIELVRHRGHALSFALRREMPARAGVVSAPVAARRGHRSPDTDPRQAHLVVNRMSTHAVLSRSSDPRPRNDRERRRVRLREALVRLPSGRSRTGCG